MHHERRRRGRNTPSGRSLLEVPDERIEVVDKNACGDPFLAWLKDGIAKGRAPGHTLRQHIKKLSPWRAVSVRAGPFSDSTRASPPHAAFFYWQARSSHRGEHKHRQNRQGADRP